MKKTIPFYSNAKDDTHCYQACLKMILKHIFPKKNFTFKKLDKLTNKPKAKWSWYPAGLVSLHKMKLIVKLYSMFDYKKFSQEGKKYIYSLFPKENAETIIENSDILSAVKDTKRMLKRKIFRKERIDFIKVEEFFKRSYDIILWVNSGLLNRTNKFTGHFVVLIGFDKNYIYVHDPGLPPRPNRKVSKKHFLKAWEYNGYGDVVLIKKPD